MQVVITGFDTYCGVDRTGMVCTVIKVAVPGGTATGFGPFVYLRVNETKELINMHRSKLVPLSKIDRTKKRLNYIG